MPDPAEAKVQDQSKTKEKVIHALAERKSMPFLEITSLCDIHGHDLEPIINALEKEGFVKVKNRDDIKDQIVTATVSLLAL